jgi:hypothetical protein
LLLSGRQGVPAHACPFLEWADLWLYRPAAHSTVLAATAKA